MDELYMPSPDDLRRARARQSYQRRTASLRRQLIIPDYAFEELRPAAERRGISVQELAERLLTVIADDELVTAVLDDEEPLN